MNRWEKHDWMNEYINKWKLSLSHVSAEELNLNAQSYPLYIWIILSIHLYGTCYVPTLGQLRYSPSNLCSAIHLRKAIWLLHSQQICQWARICQNAWEYAKTPHHQVLHVLWDLKTSLPTRMVYREECGLRHRKSSVLPPASCATPSKLLCLLELWYPPPIVSVWNPPNKDAKTSVLAQKIYLGADPRQSMSFSILALLTFWARLFFVVAGEGQVLSTKCLAASLVSTHWMPVATLTYPQVMITKNASRHWQWTRRKVHLTGLTESVGPLWLSVWGFSPSSLLQRGSPSITLLAAKLISVLQTPANWALESHLSPQQNIW